MFHTYSIALHTTFMHTHTGKIKNKTRQEKNNRSKLQHDWIPLPSPQELRACC